MPIGHFIRYGHQLVRASFSIDLFRRPRFRCSPPLAPTHRSRSRRGGKKSGSEGSKGSIFFTTFSQYACDGELGSKSIAALSDDACGHELGSKSIATVSNHACGRELGSKSNPFAKSSDNDIPTRGRSLHSTTFTQLFQTYLS